MKKLISFILVLTMLVGMCAFASAEGTLRIVVSSAEAAPGETVDITISLQDNPGVASIEFTLNFNKDVLKWKAIATGDYTGTWDYDFLDDDCPDPDYAVTWMDSKNWKTDGLFCTLTFEVNKDAKPGDYDVDLNIRQGNVFDRDEEDVPFAIEKGKVTVTGSGEPEVPSVSAYAYGASLSLTGNIGLNFFVIPSEELLADTGAYVTLDGTQYPIKDAKTRTLGDDTLYQFSKSLPAKKMNDKVTLKVFDGEGNAVALFRYSTGEDLTAGFEFSIQDYVAKALESDDAKLKKLVQAMSDYGSLAQVQFNYPGPCATVVGDLSSVTASTLAPYEPKIETGTATGVSVYGVSLVLDSETTIKLYFTPESGEALSSYVFKNGSSTVTAEQDGSYWVVRIPNIAAKDLDKTYTVTVTKGEETVVTITFSALSYAYTQLNKSGVEESLTNLVKGLYLYNQAANEFFG